MSWARATAQAHGGADHHCPLLVPHRRPHFNPIVHQVAKAKALDIVDSARLFALTSMAGIDAYIAVFDAKFAYNFWRPVTAIRNADQTGNTATTRDASWMPLGDTPLHPEYPCAHCIVSAAVAAVLKGVVGEPIGEITLTSPTAPGVTRRWTRLEDYDTGVSTSPASMQAFATASPPSSDGASVGRSVN